MGGGGAASSVSRGATWLAALLIVGGVALGIANRFLQDDAYISFRYAANLVAHGELNWNPGERPQIEGYTNFLWTLLLAGAMRAGVTPEIASQLLGLACGAGTLALTYRLGRRLGGGPAAGALATLLLATHYSFSAYMTGGLETSLQTLLLLAAVTLAEALASAPPSENLAALRRTALALSVVLALAFLTRMDAALTGLVILAFATPALRRRVPEPRARAVAAAWLLLPGALLAVVWLAWKLRTYGELLPNSWYLKGAGGSVERWKLGLEYLWLYAREYLLLPPLLLVAWTGRALWSRRTLRLLFVLIAIWSVYVASVGGDFMEFRFLVPVAPLLAILVALALDALRRPLLRWAFVAVWVAASGLHAERFHDEAGVESIALLASHLQAPSDQWVHVGEVLRSTFRGADPLVATMASGAVPYASGLETVDMLGVNDRWVARHGDPLGGRPGHNRIATLDYLLSRGTNLIVAHPQVRATDGSEDLSRPSTFWSQLDASLLPSNSEVLQIPLDAGHLVEVVYLLRTDAIDALVARHRFRELPLPAS